MPLKVSFLRLRQHKDFFGDVPAQYYKTVPQNRICDKIFQLFGESFIRVRKRRRPIDVKRSYLQGPETVNLYGTTEPPLV